MTLRIEVRSLVGSPFTLGASSQPHSPAMLTIACKASYVLEPKRCAFAKQPLAVSVRPRHAQRAAAADGLYDLPLSQPEAEVVVVGVAPMTGNLSFEDGPALPVSVVAGQPCRVSIEQLPVDKGFSLSGVHGQRQPLTTRLPSARPRVRVESTSATAHIVSLKARRLLIDLEHMRCTVCWYGEVGPQRQGVALGLALGLAKGLTTQWPDHTAPSYWLDPSVPPTPTSPVSAQRPSVPSVPPTPSSPLSARQPSVPPPVSTRPPGTAQPVAAPPPKGAPPRRTAAAASRRPVGRVISAPSTAFAPPSAPAGPTLAVPNPALAMIKRPSPSTPPASEPTQKTKRLKKSAPSQEPLVLEILWQADDCVSRLSAHPRLRRALPRRKAAPKVAPILARSAKQPAAAETDGAAALRHVMRQAPPTPTGELQPLLAASLRGDVPPEHRLVLVAGVLALLFDHKAELEIMTECARPLADEKKGGALAEAIAHADRIVKTPLAEDEGIVKRLKKQLLVAWRSTPRELPAEFLQEHTSRLLLSQRRHQTKQLWGEAQVCAALPAEGADIPVYLSSAAADHLPLVRTFKARLLAEVMPRQDEHHSCPIALRVSAMARIVDLGSN